ncbi:MAG: chalcone isomerase family protein [Myxococcales bacterium]|nr:chalcone isomerase family protein [Myxococcales bacterium]
MQFSRRKAVIVGASTLVGAWGAAAHALEPGGDGWFHTGSGVRVKTVVFVEIRAYTIHHFMKTLPSSRSKQAVIDLDTPKRLSFQMLRDVGADKIKKMFRDAYALNGYADAAAIGAFVAVFTADLKEKQVTTISYDSASQATTVATQGGGTATLRGLGFMRATWSLWFGKTDQPQLGDALISRI